MKKTALAFLIAALLLSCFCGAGAAWEEETPAAGRRLAQDELDGLTESVTFSDDGFFLSTYERPEEIDWHQVFYNGAGVSAEATPEQIREWESYYGELWTDLEVIADDVIADFVWEKTQTRYSDARRPLSLRWAYLADSGCWAFAHGDTNYEPIEFVDGYAEGDEYHLCYFRSDWENYTESREFVMTAYIRDGEWQYVSNLPADAPAPVTLLTVEFFPSREEAEQARGVSEYVEIAPREYDEPTGWCWAVLTAREDGVRYIVDRVTSAFDFEQGGVVVPEDNIASGVLGAGESIALYVSRPWHPTVRVAASLDAYWGAYCFGEDNGLNLDDSVTRYVVGHDLAGEGRGCRPENQAELARFLTDGAWAYLDEATGEVLAEVSFTDFWQMDITTVDEAYPIYLSYDRIYAGDEDAPDLMRLERADSYYTEWSVLPEWYESDSLGDYLIAAIQLDGEQLLYLTQANNGEAAMGYLLPNADEDVHEFVLHRFQGTERFEPYLVSVADPPVPYYEGPGYGYSVAGWIEENGVFTIVEEAYNDAPWGRLKSGAGWICLYDAEFYG